MLRVTIIKTPQASQRAGSIYPPPQMQDWLRFSGFDNMFCITLIIEIFYEYVKQNFIKNVNIFVKNAISFKKNTLYMCVVKGKLCLLVQFHH